MSRKYPEIKKSGRIPLAPLRKGVGGLPQRVTLRGRTLGSETSRFAPYRGLVPAPGPGPKEV